MNFTYSLIKIYFITDPIQFIKNSSSVKESNSLQYKYYIFLFNKYINYISCSESYIYIYTYTYTHKFTFIKIYYSIPEYLYKHYIKSFCLI